MQVRHPKSRRITRKRSRPRASTSDVLGSNKVERIKPKWRKHYRHLLQLQDAMARRQNSLVTSANEQRPEFSSHMADAATDTYDRDFALSVLSADQDAAYEIEEALNRIRNGRYGICELTGKPIEAARLEAIPWTRFTAEAERQLERDGAVGRARLRPPESVEKNNAAADAGEEEEEEE